MAVPSTMLPLGTLAPDFALPDFTGNRHRLSDFAESKGLLVMFICHHCPYVKHVRGELVRLAREYQSRGIAMVAIAANDVDAYPEDGPEGMQQEAREAGYAFPYLYDESQAIAKAYQAACTPDFYLFDAERRLFYRGRLDGSSPKNQVPLTGTDLRAALDALLTGQPAPAEQWPSMGCSIKWKTPG